MLYHIIRQNQFCKNLQSLRLYLTVGKPVFTRTNLRAQFGHIYLYVVSPHPISVACVFNEPRETYGPNDSCHAKFNIKNTYTLIQDMLYSNIVGVYGYEIRLEAKLNVKIDNRNVTAQVQNKEGFSTYVVHFTAPGIYYCRCISVPWKKTLFHV